MVVASHVVWCNTTVLRTFLSRLLHPTNPSQSSSGTRVSTRVLSCPSEATPIRVPTGLASAGAMGAHRQAHARPACLRCRSLQSMRVLAPDHGGLTRRGVPVPTYVRARRKLEQDLRGALVWIPPTPRTAAPSGFLGSAADLKSATPTADWLLQIGDWWFDA